LVFILFRFVAAPAEVRYFFHFFANSSFPSKRVVRLGFIIGFIALIGVLLSGLAAYRVHDQELTVDGIALARAIDVHASLVQDRLTERELLARVASGLFRAPSVIKANMLQPLRSRSMPSRPISSSPAGSRGSSRTNWKRRAPS
jgi:CHASE1-domain containing sensor protein